MEEKKNNRPKCTFSKTKLTLCAGLDAVVEDDPHKKSGLVCKGYFSMTNGVHSRDLLILKSGREKKAGIVINHCPFCGTSLKRMIKGNYGVK